MKKQKKNKNKPDLSANIWRSCWVAESNSEGSAFERSFCEVNWRSKESSLVEIVSFFAWGCCCVGAFTDAFTAGLMEGGGAPVVDVGFGWIGGTPVAGFGAWAGVADTGGRCETLTEGLPGVGCCVWVWGWDWVGANLWDAAITPPVLVGAGAGAGVGFGFEGVEGVWAGAGVDPPDPPNGVRTCVCHFPFKWTAKETIKKIIKQKKKTENDFKPSWSQVAQNWDPHSSHEKFAPFSSHLSHFFSSTAATTGADFGSGVLTCACHFPFWWTISIKCFCFSIQIQRKCVENHSFFQFKNWIEIEIWWNDDKSIDNLKIQSMFIF